MIGLGIGVTFARQRWVAGTTPPQPQPEPEPPQSWFLAGDSTAPDIVIDASIGGGHTLDPDGTVSAINNLGKATTLDFTPTGASERSTPTVAAGQPGFLFDGGTTVEPYSGGAGYAATVFSGSRRFFMLQAAVQTALTGDQTGLSIGADGSGKPRINLTFKSNGSTNQMEIHDGSKLRTLSGPLSRVEGEASVQAAFHDGVSKGSLWSDGAVLAINDPETTFPATAQPSADTITVGALGNGVYDLKGSLLGAAFDNDPGLTLDAAFDKYRAACAHFGRTARPAAAIWSLGQSNAHGDFDNPAPLSFGADAGYARRRTGDYSRVLEREGVAHGDTNTVGRSSPALYFADEWRILTGQVPLFQELAFSGSPITPGLSGKTDYWAPQNAEGDAAGNTSLMETWGDDLARFRDLVRYSAEFDVRTNVALILQGEADAAGFTAGENVTVPRLVGFMTAWLDALKSLYGIETFAIVPTGRNGADAVQVAANAAGVSTVRTAWAQVIAGRTDAHDVFPHLDHVPTPFVLDDLVVDGTGAWVSGAGFRDDGLHYTPAMYQAIGRRSARNLHAQLGL